MECRFADGLGWLYGALGLSRVAKQWKVLTSAGGSRAPRLVSYASGASLITRSCAVQRHGASVPASVCPVVVGCGVTSG